MNELVQKFEGCAQLSTRSIPKEDRATIFQMGIARARALGSIRVTLQSAYDLRECSYKK